jgi:hypothetical protein
MLPQVDSQNVLFLKSHWQKAAFLSGTPAIAFVSGTLKIVPSVARASNFRPSLAGGDPGSRIEFAIHSASK